jgi:hypothetical protein
MGSATTTTDGLSLREGVRLGGMLGLVLIILRGLSLVGFVGILVSPLSLVLALATYGVAGLRAAQRTGSTQTGAYAGVVTALVSSLLSLGASFLFIVLDQASLQEMLGNFNRILQQVRVSFQLTQSMLLGAIVLGLLVVLLLSLLVGMAMGAIGGRLGKQRRAILV